MGQSGATSTPLGPCGYPNKASHVKLDSSKYNEWQVLAYTEGRDDTLLQNEKELYECWLAEQPLAVERKEYTTPARILARPLDDSVASRKFMLGHPESDDRGDGANNQYSVKTYDASEASVAAGLDEEIDGKSDTQLTKFADAGNDEINPAEDSVDMLELTYISVMQRKLVEVLKRHEGIMIASGNALPLPAYGVVCDIDVQGHMPIKQRARQTPLRVLEKLY
ncbi:hypothetical protein PHMEG_0002383 [Phytophthora megakarya]|uniref:Reverse transcriptase n=1 Tax=Phytophthora megakarya TaxID=4795 RepID=A0A225X0S6_9STRA|nr:hypothetical protein PHMEG_0002383 [Phytophthora megakarya]